jgi:hypothetical protein
MELLPDELRAQLPPLHSQQEQDDPIVYAKFFTPLTAWVWYVTEGADHRSDYRFFGFVVGREPEWGYFTLSDLQSIRGPANLTIQRDPDFSPRPISTIRYIQAVLQALTKPKEVQS